FPVQIEAKEIVGSYCPGSYDLSINDKKFAGISQRRIRKGVAVQIYLCVNNSGEDRAQLIQQFYQIAQKEKENILDYPHVQPQTMASLSTLLGQPLQVVDVMQRLLRTLQSYGGKLQPSTLSIEESELHHHFLKRMEERNE